MNDAELPNALLIQGPGGPGGGGPTDTGDGAAAEAGPGDSEPELALDEAAWRKRALAAEDRVAELESRLTALEREAADAAAVAAAAERGRELDRGLIEAGVLDLDAARLLAERGFEGVASDDVGGTIAALRRERPWLFSAAGAGFGSTAMAGEPGGGDDALTEAHASAQHSGDRRQVLRYLRVKRGAN